MLKNLSEIIKGKNYILNGIPTILSITLLLLIGMIVSCNVKKEPAFHIVEMQGEGQYYNFSTSNIGYILSADSGTSTSILARSGDILGAFDDMIYYNNEISYSLSSDAEGIVLNNGKVFSIALSNKPALEIWLQQLDTVDLSALDHIGLGEKLPDNYMTYLQKIAAINKNIGLNIDKWNEEMPAAIALFEPRWLAIEGIKTQELKQLSSFPNLEMLLLSIDDSSFKELLPPFPNLKHLLLTDIDAKVAVPDDFLGQNPQIETLVFADCAITDFGFLDKLKNIKSMMVFNTDTILDLRFLNKLKSLTRLSILVDEAVDWNSISQCQNLRWLALSGSIMQTEFDEIIKANRKLEVVEVIDCDSISSLAVLTGLPQLKALTLSDTLHDASTLLHLNTLEYLSVPQESYSDSAYAAKLQAALPKAVIVPNDGFCMGSGWFIFFIPVLLLLAWMRKKISLKVKSRIV